MELEAYLSFNGNCEEAMAFYAAVFGGKVVNINHYGDSPMADQVPPDAKNKVMHASFEAPTLKFMGSDAVHGYHPGGNVALTLGGTDRAEATRIFNALAAGGTVSQPLNDTFWGALFGMLTDKYGIAWMVNCGTAPVPE